MNCSSSSSSSSPAIAPIFPFAALVRSDPDPWIRPSSCASSAQEQGNRRLSTYAKQVDPSIIDHIASWETVCDDCNGRRAAVTMELHALEQELAHREGVNDQARPDVDRTAKREQADWEAITRESDAATRQKMIHQHRAERKRIARYKEEMVVEAHRLMGSVSSAAGARSEGSPVGAFPEAIACHNPNSTIVGAFAELTCIPWEDGIANALPVAAAVLASQAPCHRSRNAIRHVGHMTMSLPQHHGTFPCSWSPHQAVIAARHALLSLGGDPDCHDAAIFIHSQRMSRGDPHDEETVHLLYSRIHSDGRCLFTPNAVVAAQLGRGRHAVSSGLDPANVGIARLSSAPVRRGYRLVMEGRLASYYLDLNTRERTLINLQSPEFMEAILRECAPVPLSHSGLWIPKPHYRSYDDIAGILAHLYDPSKRVP